MQCFGTGICDGATSSLRISSRYALRWIVQEIGLNACNTQGLDAHAFVSIEPCVSVRMSRYKHGVLLLADLRQAATIYSAPCDAILLDEREIYPRVGDQKLYIYTVSKQERKVTFLEGVIELHISRIDATAFQQPAKVVPDRHNIICKLEKNGLGRSH